jgi:PAS domain S-box-containing protein
MGSELLHQDALSRAALAVSTAEGSGVFERLASELADILRVDVGFIAVFADESRTQMRMLAFCLDGRMRSSFSYPLSGTPCEGVVGRQFLCVPEGALREFPHNDLLGRLGLDSYAAYPLNDAAGHALGLIGAMHRQPLDNVALCEAVLKIFGVRAVTEIERTEEQYRAIFNAAADSMVLRDADFRVVDVNPAYEAMSGRKREEVIGTNNLTMSPLALNEHVRGLHARALAGEKVVFEARARRKNGERFDIETRGVPILRQGRPHVLYIGRDITARKSDEKTLRASEEQYRAIFNAAADALVLRDAEFRIVDVNPAYVALSGFSREEVIGKQHVVANPPETEARIRALHAKALAGEPVMLETVRISKDSTRRDVELRGVPIMHRGEPHVLYVGRDISERKRNEERLRASEEQYRSIFNAATDALVLRDDQARVVDVNPAFLEMSGFTREEVIAGQRWFFAGPEQAVLAKEMHGRVIAGESVDFEVQGVRKDGTPLEVEMRAVPILYRGRPHALGMARDITEKKRAEAERAQLEAQLRQAQRMEAIGHLTGGIAHDFNNLLASIMGYIVLASERESAAGDPKLGSYLEQALASSRGARDLIQQMLTFSRGHRGAPRALDLGAAVGESLKLLRSSLPSSLELSTVITAAPAVMLDPVQLDQVLLNLSINARDAMAGSGRVAIAVHPQTLQAAVCSSCRKRFAGDFVELAVADSGPGIPPAVLERMFEPFFTTKEVGRGAGMGLATVHGIVHEHGGHVVVETAPGAGTRFRLLWPMASGKALPSTRVERKPRQVKSPLKGRVLVVDDESAVGGFMRELLESWGLEAASVTSPALAKEAFERYDLVITDQTMPGKTGFELAREMIARRPGLPVILYTGHGERITQRDVEAAGIRALLHKPVEPDLLYEMLRSELP